MLNKDFQKMIGIVEGLTSPETKITDRDLSKKILQMKRWYTLLLEEYNVQAVAVNEKWLTPKTFGVDRFARYLSGSKEDYDKWQDETKEFLDLEVLDCDIKFTEAEFEGSTVNLSILSQMDDCKLI